MAHLLPLSPSADMPPAQRYTKLEKLGEGNYGAVYKGWDAMSNRLVALKRLHLRDRKEHSLPGSTLREIYALRELRHPGIVQLLDVVFLDAWQLYMVFECLESDLKHYIDMLVEKNETVNPMLFKSYMYQLLSGINYCHQRRIMHRDLKPENILLSASGNLKIADFGLARSYSTVPPAYTHNVVTLWYRAPEVLLGAPGHQYTAAVDMWSFGCIFAELLILTPLFPGSFEIQQLLKIFELRGTPLPIGPSEFGDGEIGYPWPGVDGYPNYSPSWPKWNRVDLREDSRFEKITLMQLDICCVDILDRLLAYVPGDRITAKECMLHPFFDDYAQLRRDIELEDMVKRRRIENPVPSNQVARHERNLRELQQKVASARQPKKQRRSAGRLRAGGAEFMPQGQPGSPGSSALPRVAAEAEARLSDGSPVGLPAHMRRLSLPSAADSPPPKLLTGKRRASHVERDFFCASPDSYGVEGLFRDLEQFSGPAIRWCSAAESEPSPHDLELCLMSQAHAGLRQQIQLPGFQEYLRARQQDQ